MSQFTTGDVAFLLEWFQFSKSEKARLLRLNPNHHMKGASGHPVIILQKTSTYALVTTVSAHGAGPWDGWRAPWTSGRSYAKNADHFRSFAGTQRSSSQRAFLRLSKGAWPKPKGSWVHVENVLLVPLFALGIFTKPKCWERNGTILHVDQTSMHDLMMHIQVANPKWFELLGRLDQLAGNKPKAIMTKQLPPRPAAPRPTAIKSGWTTMKNWRR